jgi:hypothetical protein
MNLGGFYRHRRLAGALALAGMAFYVVLLPWHTVSQATAGTAPAAIAGLAEPPCHQSEEGAGAKTQVPSKQRTHCPICNGFAALQLAVSAPANAPAVRVTAAPLPLPAADDDLADVAVPAPQSRGPPLVSI